MTNMGGMRIITGFVFIFLILIGKNGLDVHHDVVGLDSHKSAGTAYQASQNSHPTVGSPILLEENEKPLQTKLKFSPAHTGPLSDLNRFFNTYFWAACQKCTPSPIAVAIHSQPKYILFQALIIPF